MLLFSQIVLFYLALSGLPLLRIACRRQVYSMILLVLSAEACLFNLICFRLYPAAYWHYLWAGNLHLGRITLPPSMKPSIDWISPLLFLSAMIIFHREQSRRKKRLNGLHTKSVSSKGVSSIEE